MNHDRASLDCGQLCKVSVNQDVEVLLQSKMGDLVVILPISTGMLSYLVSSLQHADTFSNQTNTIQPSLILLPGISLVFQLKSNAIGGSP